MELQKRKIGYTKKIPKNLKKIIIVIFAIIFIAYIIRYATGGSNIKDLILSLGTPLQKDSNGYTNLLILGTGGELHEGADLTDSIMIVSLDAKDNSINLLSVPRDLYIETKIKEGEQDRINKIYTLAKNEYEDSKLGLEKMIEAVDDALGIELHYYVKLNFNGFEDVIDALGGVDVYVDETIDDPFYPKEGTIRFEPFHITKGLRHLDGETALKYARSRKTTSDFDRSHRQQKLLYAIKEKAEQEGVLKDPDRIKDMFLSLRENIETSLSIREMINLANFGKEITQDKIKTYLIHDDPSQCGGFLYTPQRDLYGGAFVLIPASDPFDETDNYDYFHFFTKEIFTNHALSKENFEIQTLNGSGSVGLAAETKVLLKRHCFNAQRFGNAQNLDIQKTSIYAKTENVLNSETIKKIKEFLGAGEITNQIPPKYLQEPYLSNAEIIIELGQDYAKTSKRDPFDFLIDMLPSSTGDEETDETIEEVTTETINTEE